MVNTGEEHGEKRWLSGWSTQFSMTYIMTEKYFMVLNKGVSEHGDSHKMATDIGRKMVNQWMNVGVHDVQTDPYSKLEVKIDFPRVSYKGQLHRPTLT